MKKILKITGIVGILLFLLISTVFATEIDVDVNEEALELLSSSTKYLNDETINTDVFLAEDDILIENKVNGNVYVIGERVNITSESIDGDVFVMGENITINSNVNGNIYVLSNNLSIEGSAKDVFIFSEKMNLRENTTCRDIKFLGENITVDGIVNRDLYALTGNVNISEKGKVGGVLSTTNEILNNKENANKIQIIEDAFVNLENSEEQIEKLMQSAAKSISILFFISAEMTGLVIIALIVLFTSKKQINNSQLKEYGLKDTGYGLLYFVIAILIIIGLMFTLIGIPVSILLSVLLWFVCWKITLPVASIEISKAVLKQENKSKVLIFGIAFVVFTLIQCIAFVPTVGGLIKTLISLYGFGYMFRSVIRRNKFENVDAQVEII